MTSVRHVIAALDDPNNPNLIVERVPTHDSAGFGDLDITNRPYGGSTNYNALYWTNFPKLKFIEDLKRGHEEAEETGVGTADIPIDYTGDDLAVDRCDTLPDVHFYNLGVMDNWTRVPEKVLMEHARRHYKTEYMYVTYQVARKDLCLNAKLPKRSLSLEVEALQYDGMRQTNWKFPTLSLTPGPAGKPKYYDQSRRFGDTTVVHMGVNAEDFSDKVMPVGDLDAHITVTDYAGNPTWGYYHALLRIQGWPYRVLRIGTYDGCGEGGFFELLTGTSYFEESKLWRVLEGRPTMAPTGPNGEMEMQPNVRKGRKYYCQLFDLDHPGPKRKRYEVDDPEIPPQKAYVWFEVVDTITVPSTGKKGVQIRILEDGIVPCWLDLIYMQLWCGATPLGNLNSAMPEDMSRGKVAVYQVLENERDKTGVRKIVIENDFGRLVFNDPQTLEHNDVVDLGYALMKCLYHGFTIRLGPRKGKWIKDAGGDDGLVYDNEAGPTRLYDGEGRTRRLIQKPLSSYSNDRRLKTEDDTFHINSFF